jgi:glycosyltransferase involved in cell wall biosynthesis
MKNPALTSVIVPVYNCQQYLAQAIASILAQTYQPLEIIVVDDGSTDKSGEIAQSFASAVIYCHLEHGGGAKALNHGISLARGEYLAFLDADDLWMADKLSLQMKTFLDNPQLEAVFGHIRQFKSPELDESSQTKLTIPVEVSPAYHKDTLLITRQALYRVGLFNPQIQMGDFIDWYLRACEQNLKSLMLPDILAERRLHKNNMGIREKSSRIEYVRMLKASLDRRRQSGKIKSSITE